MKQIILLFILIYLLGCNSAQSPDNISDKVFTNEITDKHTRILGTHVYLKIPDDFEVIEGFSRIMVDDNIGIQIIDQEGGNFAFDENDITHKNFVHPGFKIKEDYSFKINDFNARLVRLDISNAEDRYQMVIGDSTFSLVYMSSFPSKNKIIANKIKSCLLSSFYDKSVKIEPFETAIFNLDYSDSNFELAQYSSNQFVFIKNINIDQEESSFNTVYSVMQIPSDKDYLSNIKDFAKSNLQKTEAQGLRNLEVKYENEEPLNQNKAYKHVAYGKFGDDKMLYYQIVTGNDKGILIVYGMATYNYDENLKEFEKITSSIRLE